MKLEIEISDEEILEVIKVKVQNIVNDLLHRHVRGLDEYIRDQIKTMLPANISNIIADCLADNEEMKSRIMEKIERALSAKVQKALKTTED